MKLYFERSKQNPPVPHFDHFLNAHLAFQATYHTLHFLSTHWNNRELLEPSGTSEAVFCAKGSNIQHFARSFCTYIFFVVSSVDLIKIQPAVYTSEPFLTNSTLPFTSIKAN